METHNYKNNVILNYSYKYKNNLYSNMCYYTILINYIQK